MERKFTVSMRAAANFLAICGSSTYELINAGKPHTTKLSRQFRGHSWGHS
jgi:hypothetical protein